MSLQTGVQRPGRACSEGETFDVVVIGSGSAGRSVAQATAAAGLRTAVVDHRSPGGTCALRGCDPKAFLIDLAAAVRRCRRSLGAGVHARELAVDWSAAMAAKRELIAHRPSAVAQQLAAAGIELVRGRAHFAGPDTVSIDGARLLRAEHVVLACGARPRPLGFPGADLAVTSEGFLDLDQLPRRMVTIGGGYIGLEFGCLAAAAGVAVTVVMPGQRPLGAFDPELVDRLTAAWSDDLQLCPGRTVDAVHGPRAGEAGKVFHVSLDDGRELEADLVLHAAGRIPATSELAADQAGVGLDADGAVVVDPGTMRCPGNPRVWALGDCAGSGRPQLTPVAGREAALVTAGILARELPRIDDATIVTAAFTMPPIARVGLLPDEAGEDAEVIAKDLTTATWTRSHGEAVAGYRLVVDRERDRLLGAHVLAPHAEELINTFALAMAAEVPASRLAELLPTYPSLGSLVFGALARDR